MVDTLFGFLPSKLILLCAIIAFVVPYTIYKLNQALLEIGDPAWKKEEQNGKGET